MFDKFGEFNSAEELNKKAKELKEAGKAEDVKELALENGLDQADAEDYMDDYTKELASTLMAAMGKIKIEKQNIDADGVIADWADMVTAVCADNHAVAAAVRKKSKKLTECIGCMIAFGFKNKVRVSDEIVKVTQVEHNGKTEPLRGPLYLGVPNNADIKAIIKEYYLEG